MSQTRAYKTGGTIHIVINNQVGFTTSNPRDARSTEYCTDIAKMVQAPIFHVNGDDPEAVLFVTQMAVDFRHEFKKDVVIDLFCYRRRGHNEADEPSATQPVMYEAIKNQITTRDLYAKKLIAAEVITQQQDDQLVAEYRKLLESGKDVVTANKALLAEHGPGLAVLARRSGARLDFESAVAGGIPVVRALRDSLGMTGIGSIRGVLNGTTNYVLSRLADGWRYADALADAQAKGFAEASPARDLSGEDAADKLRILAWLAFGVAPGSLVLRRRGIVPHPERLAADAALLGGVPRLVAEVVDTGDGVAAAVEPIIVTAGSDLGRTRDEENAVVIESRWNGRVRLSGPGAGGAPTASALLGDMLRSAGRTGRIHATPRPPVEDGRQHRWVISVLREPRADGVLERALQRAGVGASDVLAESDRRVAVTRPTPWRRPHGRCRSAAARPPPAARAPAKPCPYRCARR